MAGIFKSKSEHEPASQSNAGLLAVAIKATLQFSLLMTLFLGIQHVAWMASQESDLMPTTATILTSTESERGLAPATGPAVQVGGRVKVAFETKDGQHIIAELGAFLPPGDFQHHLQTGTINILYSIEDPSDEVKLDRAWLRVGGVGLPFVVWLIPILTVGITFPLVCFRLLWVRRKARKQISLAMAS